MRRIYFSINISLFSGERTEDILVEKILMRQIYFQGERTEGES
jgi:hypothetical protein